MYRFLNIDDPGWGGPGTDYPDPSSEWFYIGIIIAVIFVGIGMLMIGYYLKKKKEHEKE